MVAFAVIAIGGGVFALTRPRPVVTDGAVHHGAPKGKNGYGFQVELLDNVRVDPEFVPMKGLANCAWGRPGQDPWKGDNYSAMLAQGVPSRVAQIIAKRITGGMNNTAIVTVTNSSIEADNGFAFSPWMAMTFGRSLCYGTRANFADESHAERGKLYAEAGYFIFVPDVCGNITRLLPLYEARQNRALLQTPLLVPGLPREAQPYTPAPFYGDRPGYREEGVPNGGRFSDVNFVPEPETWALMLAGLPLLWLRRRVA